MSPQNTLHDLKLSEEQELFIRTAKEGKNILVDACIGSGKTTAIQYLCDELPRSCSILYLTYNRLLKLDAKSKITNPNVTVNNYHGFAAQILARNEYEVGVSDVIQFFLCVKPTVPAYDILIIDEYQDIEQELADLLEYIKSANPQIQIIAVGDMEQKIYDKTELDVPPFMDHFLGIDYEKLVFTQCFRLPANLASTLGRIWHKDIVGVNETCTVEVMTQSQVIDFLGSQMPEDILCLGARTHSKSQFTSTLNMLEMAFPYKFNKKTVYASIQEQDGYATAPNSDSAIFTTYDSSKGLERNICVVFDFTEEYWQQRARKPQQNYTILRNIFCVACSRGKSHIIFVESKDPFLSEATLKTPFEKENNFRPMPISKMFDYKYIENVEACFHLLDITPLPVSDPSIIHVVRNDFLIDLSPCIGNYQEALFFEKNSPNKTYTFLNSFHKKKRPSFLTEFESATFDEKILRITAKETGQDRYITQVETPFVPAAVKDALIRRLSTRFQRDENVQVRCSIPFSATPDGPLLFEARGLADVVKDHVVYELKFVSQLMHTHFLQCACYMIGLNLEKGILWNTRNNQQFEIHIPDRAAFLDAVVTAITKKQYTHYYRPCIAASPYASSPKKSVTSIPDLSKQYSSLSTVPQSPQPHIAIVDVKVNQYDRMMSFGVVIANEGTLQPVSEIYYILQPEASVGSLYKEQLLDYRCRSYRNSSRPAAVKEILPWLHSYHVMKIFSCNAACDYAHFPELSDFTWYDIINIAADENNSELLPSYADFHMDDRQTHDFNIEAITGLLIGNPHYCAVHNAICDARQGLSIMQRLDLPVSDYECTRLPAHAMQDTPEPITHQEEPVSIPPAPAPSAPPCKSHRKAKAKPPMSPRQETPTRLPDHTIQDKPEPMTHQEAPISIPHPPAPSTRPCDSYEDTKIVPPTSPGQEAPHSMDSQAKKQEGEKISPLVPRYLWALAGLAVLILLFYFFL